MANLLKAVPENVPGDFFVDATCIDCDACRQIAPETFGEARDTSYVRSQPRTPGERREALRALLSCPTGSIGCQSDNNLREVRNDFPLLIEEPVYYCGYNSPKSFGGNSYFVKHPDGNWLVDSPKFLPALVRRLETIGGISRIFLTHQDDVADAAKYAKHFGAQRIIHRLELESQPDTEVVLDGWAPAELAPGILAIPTPGHTEGHCCLLFAERFLFTGDHLWWNRDKNRLGASHDYCWHSWEQQRESMARLAQYRFEWILPGHGQRINLSADRMKSEIVALVSRMGERK